MLILSLRARILTSLIALLLLIPVAGIRLQNTALLEFFHSRTLAPWPKSAEFAPDPVQYFRNAKAWLADRAYPIMQASMLQKKFLYFVLATPPQRRVTIAQDGYVFLNGDSDADVYGIFENSCVRSHSEASVARLRDALPTLARFAHERGIALDVVIVPTALTLYAQKLPYSVPDRYRKACLDIANGHSPLLGVAAPQGVTFVYPFQPMRAASGDEAFFPKANWHAVGMSLKVVRDAYLAAIGAPTDVGDRLERGVVPSEIMITYGIVQQTPAYFLRNPHVVPDEARKQAFSNAIGPLFPVPVVEAKFYANDSPVVPESVVMVSDSYGVETSAVFAGAFRDLSQVTSNHLPADRLAELVDRAMRTQRVDRLILLVQEGNVDRIAAYAKGLPPGGSPVAPAPGAP